MSKKLVFLHTVTSLVDTFNALCKEILPADVEVVHIADEILLKVVLAQGGLSPFIHRRVTEHVIAGEKAGADIIQLTCSSISPCADTASPMVGVPILKIDEPMVDKAISMGEHIGVVATAPTTLKPTTDLVYSRASLAKRKVQVHSVLCDGAYDALFSGDLEIHDKIVRETIEGLMDQAEVVLLAQASMARVANTIPKEDQKVPILSSPRLAVMRARDVIME